MTTEVPLITGSYQVADPRASGKRTIGMFSEIAAQTSPADSKESQPPIWMRRGPGTTVFADSGLPAGCRGINTMAGTTYAVIGPNLYTLSALGVLAIVGTGIPGTSFVRMTNNTQCLFILIPGSTTAFTYCPFAASNQFAPFLNPTFLFYGAIDVWFDDTYFVFLPMNGRGFYNDDGQVVSLTGPPTFTTAAVFPREFGTDPFVGMAVDHREIVIFGTLTSEGYTNAGNPTASPFASAPATFMQQGMHPLCAYTAALQDQTIMWVANDRTVRRKDSQTPVRISNSGIEAILQSADLTGAYALTPTIGGHPLYVLTLPAARRTLCYDCLTTEWFEMQTLQNNLGYWRPLCWYNAFGLQLVGDSLTGRIGVLSTDVFTEFGTTPTYLRFTTQSVYDNHNRITHRRLELIITPGASPSLVTGAQITLFVSDDSGQTFYARETKDLGPLGQRQTRVFWQNLGQSRDRVYAFQLSDATPTFAVQILAELDGGRW